MEHMSVTDDAPFIPAPLFDGTSNGVAAIIHLESLVHSCRICYAKRNRRTSQREKICLRRAAGLAMPDSTGSLPVTFLCETTRLVLQRSEPIRSISSRLLIDASSVLYCSTPILEGRDRCDKTSDAGALPDLCWQQGTQEYSRADWLRG